jgi:HEPN domain-containing protein
VTNQDLPAAYLRSARRRLAALDTLYDLEGWNDVVREAQEVVELAGKALLRAVGADPPHVHDVAEHLLARRDRFPPDVQAELPALAEASRGLRIHRELAYYGAPDFIPDRAYRRQDADLARAQARHAVEVVARVVGG